MFALGCIEVNAHVMNYICALFTVRMSW